MLLWWRSSAESTGHRRVDCFLRPADPLKYRFLPLNPSSAKIAIPYTDAMTTSERWIGAIEDACNEPDSARSNRRITRLHYLLSEALANELGRESGPNFHSWAVWGSRKAGVTIRQEDLDSAIGNATVTAGLVGSVAGALTGAFARRWLR